MSPLLAVVLAVLVLAVIGGIFAGVGDDDVLVGVVVGCIVLGVLAVLVVCVLGVVALVALAGQVYGVIA